MHGHRPRPAARLVAGLLTGLALVGCGAGGDTAPDGDARAPDDTAPDGTTPDGTTPGDGAPGTGNGGDAAVDELDDVVALAVEDAAREHGVEPDAVEVQRAEEVEWPDGARGCPGDGEAYTQAVVPGYLVVVEVGGERVRYHAGEGEPPFRCDDPQPPL